MIHPKTAAIGGMLEEEVIAVWIPGRMNLVARNLVESLCQLEISPQKCVVKGPLTLEAVSILV